MFSQELLLKAKCSVEDKIKLVDDAKLIVTLSDCARLEGILSLDEYIPILPTEFSKRMLTCLVDSYDLETIKEIGIARLCNTDYTPTELFRNMLYLVGIVSIGIGDHPLILQEKLESYFGEDLRLDIEFDKIHESIKNRLSEQYMAWLMSNESGNFEPEIKKQPLLEKEEITLDETMKKIENHYKLTEEEVALLNNHEEKLINWIKETPQLAAICILYLEQEKAVKLLDTFDSEEKARILSEIARFKFNRLNAQVDFLIQSLERIKLCHEAHYTPQAGTQKAASLLKYSKHDLKVYDFIKDMDESLYKELIDHQYTFNSILNLRYDDMVTVIREVGVDTMAEALVVSDDTFMKSFQILVPPVVLRKILINMRKQKTIEDDYKMVISAQDKVVKAIHYLSDRGEIIMPVYRSFDDFMNAEDNDDITV